MTPPKKSRKKLPECVPPKNKIASHLILPNIPKYFIIAMLVFMLVLMVWMITPFLPALVVGAVIATGFYPIHSKISEKINHRTIAATISTLILLVIILIPVTWFVTYITNQAIDIYAFVETKVSDLLEIDIQLVPQIIKESPVGEFLDKVTEYLPIHIEDIIGFATSAIQDISQYIINKTTNFATQVTVTLTTLVIQIFVFLLSMYFFLRDGDRVIREIKELLPLPKKYREVLFNKLRQMSSGILYGIFGAAIAQGFLAGVGFTIVGINNAAFWGTVMAFFSLIPYVGSTLIWVPAAIILLVTGHWVGGIFLFLWGAFVVGTIDNLIKPLIIGESARIHPLLAFIVIVGGLFTIGLPGVIIAPYLLSIALTFLYIYKLEYQTVLNEEDEEEEE